MDNTALKVLVAEAAPTPQLLLKRVAQRTLKSEVVVAESGPEAIVAVDSGTIDLALISHELPVIDGASVLEAIRADPDYVRLPISFMSQRSDREFVSRVMELGVADYLVKPLDIDLVEARLTRTVQTLRARREQIFGAQARTSDRTLLLIATDVNFRTMAEGVLSSRFHVVSAATASEGLKAYLSLRPELVLVDEGLGLFKESLFARALRGHAGTQAEGIFLVSEDGGADPDNDEAFDGVINRSFVPETFLDSLNEVLFGDSEISSYQESLMLRNMGPALLTATRQTFGVMLGQEIEEVPKDQVAHLTSAVSALVDLADPTGGASVKVSITTSEADARTYAGALLGEDMSDGDLSICLEALEEIGRAIAGRVRAALDTIGVKVDQHDSSVRTGVNTELEMGRWKCASWCLTEDGQAFLVALTFA